MFQSLESRLSHWSGALDVCACPWARKGTDRHHKQLIIAACSNVNSFYGYSFISRPPIRARARKRKCKATKWSYVVSSAQSTLSGHQMNIVHLWLWLFNGFMCHFFLQVAKEDVLIFIDCHCLSLLRLSYLAVPASLAFTLCDWRIISSSWSHGISQKILASSWIKLNLPLLILQITVQLI